MSLKGIAKQTLAVLESGTYITPSGASVSIAADQAAALAGTRLYTPEQLDALLDGPPPQAPGPATAIEVSDETSQLAAQRALVEGAAGVVLLNYASARNAGGGFINGARAQEEDLARCSGLYPCLLSQPSYYHYNRSRKTLLYSDHLIYSPRVPFFRVRSRSFIERPFLASVLTCPAPNAGQARRKKQRGVDAALRRRAGKVLAAAQDQGERVLVLGAWGCGVFRNDPDRVADAFGSWLEAPRFASAFTRVIFAIPGAGEVSARNLAAFRRRFEP